MKWFKYVIAALITLIIFVSSIGALIVSGAFDWIGDIANNFDNAMATSNLQSFKEAMTIFYETGQMAEYNKYLDGTISEDIANDHRGLLILPCVMMRQEIPEKNYLRYLENALVEDDQLIDIDTYAAAILNCPSYHFPSVSHNFLIKALEIADNYSLYLSGYASSLPGDYIDKIGEGWAYPFTQKFNVTAHVGMYNPFGEWKGHNGTDFGAPLYTPVYAVKSGVVVASGTKTCSYDNASQAGCNVQILTPDGLLIKYYHFARASHLEVGDIVKMGDLVGVVGSTGYSTGPHLHLEIRVYSTLKVLDYCQFMDCDDPLLPS